MDLPYQANPLFLNEFAQVNERISHTTERGVDAYSGLLSYLLEGEVIIETHHNDFALRSGQIVKQTAD